MSSKLGESYEILYDRTEGKYDSELIRGIRTHTYRCGKFLDVECYPIWKISAGARREAKRRKSTPAMAALNLRNTKKKLRRLMECNFDENDVHLTLTYDYGMRNLRDKGIWEEYEKEKLPLCDADARRDIQKFFRRLRYKMTKQGVTEELKYIYVMESTKEADPNDMNAPPPRYHYHIVLKCGLDRDEIEKTWGMGYANADRLDMRYGLDNLAAYLTKQRRVTRRWAYSKNLKKPRETIADRKMSRRRAMKVAEDVITNGRAIFEQLYPGYRMMEDAQVRYSDFTPGAYIYARLRRD